MSSCWKKWKAGLTRAGGIGGLVLALGIAGCGAPEATDVVVVYTSQDQVYSEPILKQFTAETGIEVKAVYDTESAKTAGLANRLRFEKENPQCDLFWNNEEMHTRLLAQDGVFREQNGWRTVGYRTRRLVINTNLVRLDRVPGSLLELTNEVWNGRVALAYPLFGTTATHFLALKQLWGEEQWKAWCYGLVRNGAKVVDGNSVVVKLVGAGEVAIGLTDSDDILAGQRQNLPVMALPLTEEFIAIPNTIGLLRYSPHPENADLLAGYLAKPETLRKLVEAGALEGVDLKNAPANLWEVDWSQPREAIQQTAYYLKVIFVRS